MSKRDKADSGFTVVGASQEEIEQLDGLRAGHPWQLSLATFLQRVGSEYGFELCGMDVLDPKGKSVHLPYLKNRSTGRVVLLPGNLRMEDQLDPVVTRSLCRRIAIPPEDFGLLPDGPHGDDFEVEH